MGCKEKLKAAVTLDELKKSYLELVKQYHPDLNPGIDDTIIKDINNIFDEMKQVLKDPDNTKKASGQVDCADDFVKVVEHLINCEGLIIEACGWFIWISGTTREHKEKIRSLKEILNKNIWWSKDKGMWYIKPDWYRGKHKNSWSMQEIRSTYGSQKAKRGSKARQRELIET